MRAALLLALAAALAGPGCGVRGPPRPARADVPAPAARVEQAPAAEAAEPGACCEGASDGRGP